MRTNLGNLGNINYKAIASKLYLKGFWNNVKTMHDQIVKNPTDIAAKTVLSNYISNSPNLFREGIPDEVYKFGISESNHISQSGRSKLLRQLLVSGFPIPNVINDMDPAQFSDHVVGTVVSDYFYDSSLAFLLASRKHPNFLLLSTTSIPGKYEWVVTNNEIIPEIIGVKYGLGFFKNQFSFMGFSQPLRTHYIYPIDSYYKKSRAQDLLTRAERYLIPMPGSVLIRSTADDKRLCSKIFSGIDNLKLPIEDIGNSSNIRSKDDIKNMILNFTKQHYLSSVFIKPNSGFGGEGVSSFNIRQSLDEAIQHAKGLLDSYGGFLLQERLVPVSLIDKQKEWNIRQYAMWTPDGIKSLWKHFRMGETGLPINTMTGAEWMTQKQLIECVDLPDSKKVDLQNKLLLTNEIGKNILKKLDEYLLSNHRDLERMYRGSGSSFEPGLISMDLIVTKKNKGFDIYFLEINDHGSGGIYSYEMLTCIEQLKQSPLMDGGETKSYKNSLADEIVKMMKLRGEDYKKYIEGHSQIDIKADIDPEMPL